MSKFAINYRGGRYVGLLLNDNQTITKIDAELTLEYFNEIGSKCKTVISSIPNFLVAVQVKYGSSLFDSPFTDWSFISNKHNDNQSAIEKHLGELFVKSSFSCKYVITVEVSRALAIMAGKSSEMAKFLALNHVDQVFISYF